MAWIEVHQELVGHLKIKRLKRALNIPTPHAVGHCVQLWLWCMSYAKSGDLSSFEDGDIADAAGWEGDAALFVESLTDAGFLDENGKIHDWQHYGGKYFRENELAKERMRKSRGRYANVRVSSGEVTPKFGARVEESRVEESRREDKGVQRVADAPSPAAPVQLGMLPDEPSRKRFQPPTEEEARTYASGIGMPQIEVDLFLAHYGSNGWKVGKNKMTDWHQAMSGWHSRNQKQKNEQSRKYPRRNPSPSDSFIGTSSIRDAQVQAILAEIGGGGGGPEKAS